MQFNSNLTFSINKITSFQQTTYAYDENYTAIDSLRLDEILTNRDISFSPSLIGYGELSYQLNDHWNFSFQNKYVSAQYLDNTQNESKKISAYNVNNISISYVTHFKKVKDVKLFLLLNNIFDIEYQSNGYTFNGGRTVDNIGAVSPSIDYNYYYPQAGFNFMFGINLKF